MRDIRVTVREPEQFIDNSFRCVEISASQGIRAVAGKLKSDPEAVAVQAYRFADSDPAQAEKWTKAHDKLGIVDVIRLNEDHDLGEDANSKVTKFVRGKILAVDVKAKTIDAIVSTESVDRDNEIIMQSGWQLGDYKKHPVLLSSHRYDKLTNHIGEALAVGVANGELRVKFQYYAGEGNPEADWAWVLAQKGIAMFSVGFKSQSSCTGDQIPEQYRGLNPERVFLKCELLEISQVVVGSNRGALQMGIDEPTVEQNQYAFEVVKAFGAQIPEFMDIKQPELAKPPATPAAVTPPTPAPEPEKMTRESVIVAPVVLKDMREMETITRLYREGKLVSKDTEVFVRQTVTQLQDIIKRLNETLDIAVRPETMPDQTGKVKII